MFLPVAIIKRREMINILLLLLYFTAAIANIHLEKMYYKTFRNFSLASTGVSGPLKGNLTRCKKSNRCNTLQIKLLDEIYVLCLHIQEIVENTIVDEETKLIVCNTDSKKESYLNESGILTVTGYAADQPFTSCVTGYLSNNKLYGKVDIKNRTFYIENILDFPETNTSNSHTNNLNNAIVYEDSSLNVFATSNSIKDKTWRQHFTWREYADQNFYKNHSFPKPLG